MKPARVETLVWVLIYGGLVASMLGLWVLDRVPLAGRVLVAAGGLAALAGVVLVWVRSRMRTGDEGSR